METITLNIKKEFLQAILAGVKKVEYREESVSLNNKLNKLTEIPFLLRLINGMTKNAPEATVIITKLLQDTESRQLEFHIDSIHSSKNCDSLLKNIPDFGEDIENRLPSIEISSNQLAELESGNSDAFVLKDTQENRELLGTLLPLPRWVSLTTRTYKMDAVLTQILGDQFVENFELRILQKPK